MLKAAVPLLVSVTVWAALVVPTSWLPKLRLVAERLTAGATPVPLKLITWGLPAASSVTLIWPVRVPVEVGAKVTLNAQLAPAATVEPQVFVSEKSPLMATLEIVSVDVPVFVRDKVWAALVVPTSWLPKLRLVAEKEAMG